MQPAAVSTNTDLSDDNSLLNDNLLKDSTNRLMQHNQMDDNELLEEVEMLDADDEDDDEELKTIKQYETILEELEVNQYAYDKYVRLCDLSQ